jgi:hypothetical protein
MLLSRSSALTCTVISTTGSAADVTGFGIACTDTVDDDDSVAEAADDDIWLQTGDWPVECVCVSVWQLSVVGCRAIVPGSTVWYDLIDLEI